MEFRSYVVAIILSVLVGCVTAQPSELEPCPTVLEPVDVNYVEWSGRWEGHLWYVSELCGNWTGRGSVTIEYDRQGLYLADRLCGAPLTVYAPGEAQVHADDCGEQYRASASLRSTDDGDRLTLAWRDRTPSCGVRSWMLVGEHSPAPAPPYRDLDIRNAIPGAYEGSLTILNGCDGSMHTDANHEIVVLSGPRGLLQLDSAYCSATIVGTNIAPTICGAGHLEGEVYGDANGHLHISLSEWVVECPFPHRWTFVGSPL